MNNRASGRREGLLNQTYDEMQKAASMTNLLTKNLQIQVDVLELNEHPKDSPNKFLPESKF